MKNIKLELILKDRTLIANNQNLKLDESLFYAGVSEILNREDEIALELKYNKKETGFIEDEGEKIYEFLEQKKLSEKIDVSMYPEENFPSVALTGNYRIIIYG